MSLDRARLRLIVVTSSGSVPGRGHREVATAAIAGGATAIQLRAPELDDAALRPLAEELSVRCREADVLFVVNDRADVASSVGAGVHVGRTDNPAGARAVIGPAAVLGMSAHGVPDALEAAAAGADYLGVTVWATPTKPDARPGGLEGLRSVVEAVELPVVAIGGLNEGNARAALDAGASGVAVVSAVGAAEDPAEATRRLADAVGVPERP